MKLSKSAFILSLGLALSVLLAAPALAGPAAGPATPASYYGDFNADGRADILVQNAGGLLYVLVTDSSGLAVDTDESNHIADLEAGWEVTSVADFNGDDHADVLIQDTGGDGSLFVMITDPEVSPLQVSVALSGSPGQVPAGWTVIGANDTNGDGNADVAVENTTTQQIWTFITNTDGISFDSDASGGTLAIPSGWSVEGGGDFNGDGRNDLIVMNSEVTNQSNQLWVFITNSDGISFSASLSGSPGAVPEGWEYSGNGQFTPDTASSDYGVTNIDAINPPGLEGLIYLFVTDNYGVSADAGASAPSVQLPAGVFIQVFADFNNDGIADTLVQDEATGLLYVYLNSTPGSDLVGQGNIATLSGGFSFSNGQGL